MTPRNPTRPGPGAVWCLAVWLALGVFSSRAETRPSHLVSEWRIEEGLPGNSVTSIVQTPDGYLWFGTFQGLVRFDGVRFRIFDSTTPGLESERATRLFVDRSGALWVTMEYGQVSRYADGRFTPMTAAEGWPGISVKWMASAPDGAVLLTVGADDFGPRRLLEYRDGRFRELLSGPDYPPGPARSRPSVGDMVVEVERSGRMWVVQDRRLGGLENGQWIPWSPPGDGPAPDISRIAASPRGGLWVCSGGRIRRLVEGRPSPGSPEFPWPASAPVMEMMEDSAGQLWVGSWGQGLLRCAPDGSTEWFTNERGFPNNTATCVFEDHEHSLWVGTASSGLLRLRRREFSTLGRAEGLPASSLGAIAEDISGHAWAGVTASGLFRLAGDRFEGPLLPDGYLPGPTVRTIVGRRDGSVWAGLHGNGLFRADAGGIRWYSRKDGLDHEVLFTLLEDRAGTLWIGGDKGLTRFDGGRFITLSTHAGLPDKPVSALAEDSSGTLWAGTLGGGLCRMRGGRFETLTRRDGLAHDAVSALLADPDGTLWIGTAGGGLGRLRNGRFATFSANTGLPGNHVGAVLDDGLGYLWLNSNRGVFRVARSELDAVADGQRPRLDGATYLPVDGLASIECSFGSPAGFRARDGRLWFASTKGINIVDPRRLSRNTVPPAAMIEEVWVDGVLLGSNDPSRRVPMPGKPGETSIVVPAGSQRVEIAYTGLSLAAPERVRFRHRLEGLDADWEEAGNRRLATYHRLSPGVHRFRVIASNNDGVWSNVGAEIDLRMLPAWWQTWSFRTAMTLLLAASGATAYGIRIRALNRQRHVQEDFSRRLIASQEAERKRIAAELHDSLGQNLLVIKSRIALAQQQSSQPDRLSEQLGEAASMATQAIREVREISQNLRPFQLDELGLGKALVSMTRKIAAASPTHFSTDIADLQGVFPPEFEINFYRIVQECLSNVVRHSGATCCSVVITRDAGQVRLQVTDDGCGIPAAGTPSSAESQEGFGLTGIRQRARTMSAEVAIEAGPDGGTRVTVSVPLTR